MVNSVDKIILQTQYLLYFNNNLGLNLFGFTHIIYNIVVNLVSQILGSWPIAPSSWFRQLLMGFFYSWHCMCCYIFFFFLLCSVSCPRLWLQSVSCPQYLVEQYLCASKQICFRGKSFNLGNSSKQTNTFLFALQKKRLNISDVIT